MIVTRFAPSPTGLLHLGHAFAAIFAHDAAQKARGRFLLRIEDIDSARCKPEFDVAILDDLAWLDLVWEEPVLQQSQRIAEYGRAIELLAGKELLYPCFCTRKEIAAEIAASPGAPHGPDGAVYPGTCRTLSIIERRNRMTAGQSYALRLDVEAASRQTGALYFEETGEGPHGERGRIAVNPTLFGDIVLARKDVPSAYHLAVVVDDAFQGVTLVTRGNDLFAATHVQRLLQALLDLPQPAYAHHRLLLDATGRKFSKRDNAVTLRALRRSGLTPSQLRTDLGLRNERSPTSR